MNIFKRDGFKEKDYPPDVHLDNSSLPVLPPEIHLVPRLAKRYHPPWCWDIDCYGV